MCTQGCSADTAQFFFIVILWLYGYEKCKFTRTTTTTTAATFKSNERKPSNIEMRQVSQRMQKLIHFANINCDVLNLLRKTLFMSMAPTRSHVPCLDVRILCSMLMHTYHELTHTRRTEHCVMSERKMSLMHAPSYCRSKQPALADVAA